MLTCKSCGSSYQIGEWPYCPHGHMHKIPPSVHIRERTVVFENPLTGAVRYPGRNDQPMPDRYAQQGYIRREFETSHALSRFEKEKGVVNEALHCNKGNGLDSPDPSGIPEGVTIKDFGSGGSSELTIGGKTVEW